MNRIEIDVEPTAGDPVRQAPQLAKTVSYVNSSNFTLFLTESTGAFYVVSPKSGSNKSNTLEIVVTYRGAIGCVDFTGLGNGLPKELFQKVTTELQRSGLSTISYMVTNLGDLYHTDMIVLKQLGLCISTKALGIEAGEAFNKVEPSRNAMFSMSVAIVVSSREQCRKKYVRFYTNMAEVVPIYSRFHDEGVYLIIKGGERVEDGNYIYYSFDELISPVRVFDDIDDARKFKFVDAIPDIAELRNKLEEKAKDEMGQIRSIKADLEIQHKEAMNNMARDKAMQEQHYREQDYIWKQRSEINKSYYESKSMDRKDRTESLKAFPALLAAGVALLGLLL